jgi:hypothetical protein
LTQVRATAGVHVMLSAPAAADNARLSDWVMGAVTAVTSPVTFASWGAGVGGDATGFAVATC